MNNNLPWFLAGVGWSVVVGVLGVVLLVLLGGCAGSYGQGTTESDKCEYARYGVFQHVEYETNCKGYEKWGLVW